MKGASQNAIISAALRSASPCVRKIATSSGRPMKQPAYMRGCTAQYGVGPRGTSRAQLSQMRFAPRPPIQNPGLLGARAQERHARSDPPLPRLWMARLGSGDLRPGAREGRRRPRPACPKPRGDRHRRVRGAQPRRRIRGRMREPFGGRILRQDPIARIGIGLPGDLDDAAAARVRWRARANVCAGANGGTGLLQRPATGLPSARSSWRGWMPAAA